MNHPAPPPKTCGEATDRVLTCLTKAMKTPLLALLVATAPLLAGGETPRLLQDFEGTMRLPATGYTGVTAVIDEETPFGHHCLKLTVDRAFPWRRPGADAGGTPIDAIRVATLGGPYLSPATDAIRLRVRSLSGQAILAVGGPVSQIGTSDVLADPHLVAATAASGAWQTVEFSLNRRLARNYRRPNFTRELPVIAYTRWAQEPLYLCLIAPQRDLPRSEDAVVLVDEVEEVSHGEGRPFPSFAAEAVQPLAMIADFEAPALPPVVSIAHGSALLDSFEAGYRRPPLPAKLPRLDSPFVREEGIAYPAPRFTRVAGPHGTGALQAECLWAEEGAIAAIKTRGNAAANALAFAIKPDFPATRTGPYAFRTGPALANAVDIVVFVGPADGAFPWRDLEPSDALRQALRDSGYQGPGVPYDYALAMDKRATFVRTPDIRQAGAFAFYTARRYAPAGVWTPLVVPWADFLCVYGQGACRDLMTGQLPIPADRIAAVGFLAPFGSGHGTLALDDIAYVHVPGTTPDLRSFWQDPVTGTSHLVPLPRYSQYGTWSYKADADGVPAFLMDGPVQP